MSTRPSHHVELSIRKGRGFADRSLLFDCSLQSRKGHYSLPRLQRANRGFYIPPGVSGVGGIFKSLASYCYECGKPYPWTAEKLEAAKGLAEEPENVTSEDRVTAATGAFIATSLRLDCEAAKARRA